MLEIIMAHIKAEIDILKCKICIRCTFFTTLSEITEKVGPDHVLSLQLIFFYISKRLIEESSRKMESLLVVKNDIN